MTTLFLHDKDHMSKQSLHLTLGVLQFGMQTHEFYV